MDWQFFIAFLVLGLFTGFFAGLFGIGGGGIMVPVLTLLFSAHFGAAHALHMALATSMAAIVPTALSSLRTHNFHKAVLWPVVWRLAPGVLVGTFLSTFLAKYLSVFSLAIFFACFMFFVAAQMIVNRPPKAARQLPSAPVIVATGSGIGAVSALVAIGGGTLTVPFLLWCNIALPVAIGTSAAVGFPIALAGALGYWVNGLSVAGLPAFSLGYIYMPAVLLMASMSFITATFGARLAHKLPLVLLKKLFAALLVGLSVEMLYSIFCT